MRSRTRQKQGKEFKSIVHPQLHPNLLFRPAQHCRAKWARSDTPAAHFHLAHRYVTSFRT